MKQEKPNLDDRASRLRVARLALVQAIYQNALAPLPDEALLRQFQESRAFQEQMEVPKQVWDHFERVLTGVLRDQSFLDDFLSRHFPPRWTLSRMDKTLHAILLAASYELLRCEDVPVKAAINEYVGITHAFYNAPVPGFVNGVLDSLSRDGRRG